MKTLTALTAAAALIAGMAIAGAQNAPSMPPENSSPNQINKGSLPEKNSGTQSQRSAKTAGPAKQSNITGNARFCMEMTPGGGLECKYQTMASCEQAGKPNNRICHPNPNMASRGSSSTTGSR